MRRASQLADVKDVVAIRPGYKYPPEGQPVPAIVVAVTPGTTPVQAAELETKFGVPFTVIDATVEEQLAAAQKASRSRSARPPDRWSRRSRRLLGSDEALLDFAPPKTGSYEEPEPPNLPLVKERWS